MIYTFRVFLLYQAILRPRKSLFLKRDAIAIFNQKVQREREQLVRDPPSQATTNHSHPNGLNV